MFSKKPTAYKMMITYIRLGIANLPNLRSKREIQFIFSLLSYSILIVASECFFVNQLRRLYKKFIFP